MDAHSRAQLDRILHPRSVAVVGASGSPGKFGWIFLKSLAHIGFSGKLYPINKKSDTILGYKTYPTLSALPEVPDMVVVTIPARNVPEALEEALAAGCPGAVVITAGFGEDSDEGKRLEDRVREIARRGIRVIGPNCFGVYSPKAGITVIPGSGFSRESGPVGFFAQSGGLTADLGQVAIGRGVKFSAMVSYGNAADVNELDMLDYFAHDDQTSIIAAYLEGVSDGPRFLGLLKEVTRVKPVIIWKGGTSATGARMVMSHTGSMGGQAAVWEAVISQTGAVRVRGLTELIDTLAAFSCIYPRAGSRVAVMGGGGALGVEASDLVDELGLVMPVFGDGVQQQINTHLPEFGKSAKNPVDTGTPLVGADSLVEIMRIIAAPTRRRRHLCIAAPLPFPGADAAGRRSGADPALGLCPLAEARRGCPGNPHGLGQAHRGGPSPDLDLSKRRGPRARAGNPPRCGRLSGRRVRRLPDGRSGAQGAGTGGEVSGIPEEGGE